MAVLYPYQPKRYWCTEESRFGLKTVTRRRLTPRGVKPNGQVQWSFQSYYLSGLVEPLTGENLFLEYSHLNTNGFEAYLPEFSQTYPDELPIRPLDQARFHPAKRLIRPDNIILW